MAPSYGDGSYGDGFYKGFIIGEIGIPYNKINHLTGLCLRFGITNDQGPGWSQYENGEYWLWPETEPIEVVDDNGHQRFLCFDELSGRYWEFGTRDGPQGSGLTAIYLDKMTDYGGAEIPCEVRLKELTGPQEHRSLEHVENHWYIRPNKPENKGNAAYNTYGYRLAFYLDSFGYIDGIQTEKARTKEVPDNGDLCYDRKLDCRRLIMGFYTSTSEFKLAKADCYINVKDMTGIQSERAMKEWFWQAEVENMFLWVTRGYQPLLNRATNVLCTGEYYALVSGPDGGEDAMSFIPGERLIYAVGILPDSWTLMFWIKDYDLNSEIFSFTTGVLGIGLALDPTDGDIYLQWQDSANAILQNLGWNGTDWAFLKITKSGNSLYVSKNGVLLNTFILLGGLSYGGTMARNTAYSGILYDIRGINAAVSEAAGLYAYNDIIENQGKGILWPY